MLCWCWIKFFQQNLCLFIGPTWSNHLNGGCALYSWKVQVNYGQKWVEDPLYIPVPAVILDGCTPTSTSFHFMAFGRSSLTSLYAECVPLGWLKWIQTVVWKHFIVENLNDATGTC